MGAARDIWNGMANGDPGAFIGMPGRFGKGRTNTGNGGGGTGDGRIRGTGTGKATPAAPLTGRGTSTGIQFDVAHIREQGQDMIIIVVPPAVSRLSGIHQQEMYSELQHYAHEAGLAGRVVLVWRSGPGRMSFRAPTAWISFFQSVSLAWVGENINRRLTIG